MPMAGQALAGRIEVLEISRAEKRNGFARSARPEGVETGVGPVHRMHSMTVRRERNTDLQPTIGVTPGIKNGSGFWSGFRRTAIAECPRAGQLLFSTARWDLLKIPDWSVDWG
jgi:hypothetical protein